VVSAVRPEPLEMYLRTVRDHLQSLSPEDSSEILRELRSHVLDRVKGDLSNATVSATLTRLGDPREIARINLRMRVAAVAVAHPTPLAVARTLSRLAAIGGKGFLIFILSLTGYAFAGCWVLTALAKPFAPDRVGLWLLPDPTGDLSLSLGRLGAGAAGHDILGWWIIPIGLMVGAICAFLTYRIDLRFIRELARPQSTGVRPTV
jgi:hypothetical protein